MSCRTSSCRKSSWRESSWREPTCGAYDEKSQCANVSARYKYPGKIPVPANCADKCAISPCPIIVRGCRRKRAVKRNLCKNTINDRAVVRITPQHMLKEVDGARFILESFAGPILIPTNLKNLCGSEQFKEDDIVAIFCEDKSGECETSIDNSVFVKIVSIKRVWSQLIKKAIGEVTLKMDNNGVEYYVLRETYSAERGHPFYEDLQDSLTFGSFEIEYEIVNIIGVTNLLQTLQDLEGSFINTTYVDYGVETRERSGIPIVITSFIGT